MQKILCSVALSFWIAQSPGPVVEAARPNVVLILVDDAGFSDFGCYGGEIRTPNIDRLAREGIRFTQFYSNPVCIPTRASLLTGLYPQYPGEKSTVQLSSEMVTIAEVLRDVGYRTSLSGKWHLGRDAPNHPLDRGFESFYGLLDGCCNHHDPGLPDPEFEGGRTRYWADDRRRVTEFPEDFYSTDAITDHAIQQLRSFHESGQPFFLHIAYTAPHSPLHAEPEDIAKYDQRYLSGWDELRQTRFSRQKELGLFPQPFAISSSEPEVTAWSSEPLQSWNANLMAVYAAMIDRIDQNVGKVLQTLLELGIEQDTLVLVLSDNGGSAEQAGGDDSSNVAGPREHYVSCGAGWAFAQNTPFRRYKGWCHEGGIAVPLIVRWPGKVSPNTFTQQVGHVIDLLPTIAEAVGIGLPVAHHGQSIRACDGQSLVSAMCNPEFHQPRKLYWAWMDNRAFRDDRWKIVWDQNVGRWELYDIEHDRGEINDLARNEPQRVRRMADDWNLWASRTGAKKGLGNRIQLSP